MLAQAQRKMTIACLTLSESRPPLPAYAWRSLDIFLCLLFLISEGMQGFQEN